MTVRLLSSAQMQSAYRTQQLPAWVPAAYQEFLTKVVDDIFPRTFGIVAHRKGNLRYA